MFTLKSFREIEKMKKANRIVADILDVLIDKTKPGVTPNELDRIAHELTKKSGAEPAFLGYHDYPKVLCASVNEEVVHGIPDDRVLKEGDIIGLDFGVSVDGWFGDSAVTVPVGKISSQATKLLQTTERSLYNAIAMMQPGNRLGDIGFAVQSLAENEGYGVVRDFVGHGIGRALHEEPQVPNFGKRGAGLKLEVGMVLAIEPMITIGNYKVKVLKNNWTAVTVDGSLAAHFEHTVAITEQGPVILSDRGHCLTI